MLGWGLGVGHPGRLLVAFGITTKQLCCLLSLGISTLVLNFDMSQVASGNKASQCFQKRDGAREGVKEGVTRMKRRSWPVCVDGEGVESELR